MYNLFTRRGNKKNVRFNTFIGFELYWKKSLQIILSFMFNHLDLNDLNLKYYYIAFCSFLTAETGNNIILITVSVNKWSI